MPEFGFEVWCSECGAGLCQQTSVLTDRSGINVTVGPCEKCLEKAELKGHSEGYDSGYEDGLVDGRAEEIDG